ncbi:Trimethyllysine dioxygenase [Hypoxylon trugodes]|uniref:Trimethyllysine dioxygenase n=1 Tax=Hypoxylon trugodes TaxID=326681 RepID=UPI00219877D8|nr:Trimethyllysine dioxygenase [Hypoxylon trugodes]KAI1390913.1 Trimethyllysine dioxygenase [Hypoxylon trugodes]
MNFKSSMIRCSRHLTSRNYMARRGWQRPSQLRFRTLATATTKPRAQFTSDCVKFEWPESNDKVQRTNLPNLWLRDNCRCNSCVNQDTMQRNFNTFDDIPIDVQPSRITEIQTGLEIEWSRDHHKSFYPWDFLEFYLYNSERDEEPIEIEYFGAQGPQDTQSDWPPSLKYDDFSTDETKSVGRLTDLIRRRGFAFVTEVPFDTAEPTQKLLEKIAFIRQTHYGGFYDFIPDLSLADTAYTNLALGAHTDTTYFTDPAGLQAFHLLSHHDPTSKNNPEKSLGGKSLLVDGFHAAKILKEEDSKSFAILTETNLPWHASGNKGITISPDKPYPVLELKPGTDKMHRVRWNNDDRGVLPLGKTSLTQWYDAARQWHRILKRESLEYWFQLEPGKVLIFDNWRVLHGRSAFTGVRRICGGYINRDDFISRWRNTNYPRDEILNRVIG